MKRKAAEEDTRFAKRIKDLSDEDLLAESSKASEKGDNKHVVAVWAEFLRRVATAKEREATAKEREATAKERIATAKESAATANERAAKAEQKLKSIVVHGLPPLLVKPRGSTSGPSIPSDDQHQPATLVEKTTTCCVRDIHAKLATEDTNAAWSLHFSMRGFRYITEADVRILVVRVLVDVASSLAPLLGNTKITFSAVLSTFGDDLWVLLMDGVVVGVVQVKKPGEVAMTNENIIGECLDYMHDICGLDGLDHVFCILTSYDKWRILWLPDTDTAAKDKRTPSPANHIPQKLTCFTRLLGGKLPPWPGSGVKDPTPLPDPKTPDVNRKSPVRVVHGSPVFSQDHGQLVDILASVLLKMLSSPATQLEKKLPDNFSLSYATMPDEGVRNLLLLFPLGCGHTGRVWLASSLSGSACVIKFAGSRDKTPPPLKLRSLCGIMSTATAGPSRG